MDYWNIRQTLQSKKISFKNEEHADQSKANLAVYFHNLEQHYERTFSNYGFSQNYPFQQGKFLQGY